MFFYQGIGIKTEFMTTSLKVELHPTLMDNAYLYLPQGHKPIDHTEFNTIIAISKDFGREYTFCTKIDKIEFSDIDRPILYVDKDIVNILITGDTINITPFRAPMAETVTFLISESSSVIEGSWGTMLQDQFEGQILDVGGELLFTYPTSDPFIERGVLESSIPRAPVRLLPDTQVFVKKQDSHTILGKMVDFNDQRVERIAKYEKQLEENTFELVGDIKNDAANSLQTMFNFTANPQAIYEGIKKQLGSTWKSSFDDTSLFEDVFYGTLHFVLYEHGNIPSAIMEFFISSKDDEGRITMALYGSRNTDIRTINSKVSKDVRTLAVTVATSSKIVDDKCPNCGGTLNLDNIDSRGWVDCMACMGKVVVPAKYRYD